MTARQDRIEGTVLGTAAGDALGAPYEFGPPLPPQQQVPMKSGGPWALGEWTDDTAMMVVIAEVAAEGLDLRDDAAQDRIVRRWHDWSLHSKDVGLQTRSVLSRAAQGGPITAARARAESALLHTQTGRTAGNGSLMRTAAVALAYLDDEEAMVRAARALSDLTHHDPLAGDACVLWCSAIRHAVHTGEIDARIGLPNLAADRRDLWHGYLTEAESLKPWDFANNGFVVQALQGAWSAIHGTAVPDDDLTAGQFRADHLRLALENAVRGGRDTDTVAAIAGGLLGAAYGASAIPLEWREHLHGWPGIRAHHLVNLASLIDRNGAPDPVDLSYPDPATATIARHPHDDRVILGGIAVLRELPDEVDAVVSLCRLAKEDLRTDMAHIEVRLIDSALADENPHLDFVLLETVRAIERLRTQGRTVLVHCVAAYSRTPTIAALYGSRVSGVTTAEALADVQSVLPRSCPNAAFRNALARLGTVGAGTR